MRTSMKDLRQQRIIWLAWHRTEWEHLPECHEKENNKAYREWKRRHARPIFDKMKAEGLIAPSTSLTDTNIAGLINLLRQIDRGEIEFEQI